MPARARRRRGRSDAGSTDHGPFATVLAGRAIVRGRLQPVEVGVDDEGWIRRVARDLRGERRADLGEAILLPSATDLHVHLRDPGGPDPVEDLLSGTQAAALGGVGCVADMPNTDPPITTLDQVRAKRDRARGRIAIDLAVIAGLVSAGDVGRLASEVGAFKLFLSPTTGIENPPAPGPARELLASAAATGLAVSVHAEDPTRFRTGAPPSSTESWNGMRPVDAERSAVESLLPWPAAGRLNVAHVTSAEVGHLVIESGAAFEVSPHHLLLSASPRGTGFAKVNPPLRPEAVRAALWEEFRAGRVPLLASDHAPHRRSEKEKPFPDAPAGVPGVETMVPLLLERVRSGDLSLEVLQRAACDHPARWLGLPWGRIAPGHRANLIAVHFRRRGVLHGDRLRTRCGWTPFEGWPAVFPTMHFRYGDVIVEDGEYAGRPVGTVVRPEYAPGFRRTPAT